MAKRGLWDNIHAKRKRIKAGSGERMRKPGSKGAPTVQDFKDAQEEVAANSVSGGNVAGLGVGPQGEPPVKKSKVLKRFSKFTGK